jgi:anaerobic selenocysteine-containing dehydrogenase
MAAPCSRRDILKAAPAGLALAALAGALAPRDAVAQQKVSKAMVQYQTTAKGGHQCSGCSNFVAPGSCKVVAGPISPHGWCSIWTPK